MTNKMVQQTIEYCPNCMEKVTINKANGSCPFCGCDMNVENEPHQLSIGTLLDKRYMVGKVLGQGGFGITYIGLDTRLGMKIAIKEYYPSAWAGRKSGHSNDLSVLSGNNNKELYSKGISRFLDEAKCLAYFSAMPGVVSVHNFFEENETAYIVMEYVDGLSLSRVLTQNGVMSFEEAVTLMTPVMKALSAIHRRGMIHRDISPANMILGNNGNVKIIDFGAAREFSTEAENSLSVYLKPGYTPVEQYQTNGDQGPWTDVYAVTASIYKLVTGVTPVTSMDRIFKDTLVRPSELNSSVTKEQEAVILQGMAIRSEDRPQTMDDLCYLLNSTIDRNDSADKGIYDGTNKDVPEPALDNENTLFEQGYNSDEATSMSYTPEDTLDKTVADFNTPEDTLDKTVTGGSISGFDSRTGASLCGRNLSNRTDELDDLLKNDYRHSELAMSAPPRRGNKGNKKKFLWFALAAILALLLVAKLTSVGNSEKEGTDALTSPKKSTSGSDIIYTNYTVTKSEAASTARNKNITSVHFEGCNVSDAALKALAKSTTISSVSFEDCTGYEGLEELADAAALNSIEVLNSESEGNMTDFDKTFPCDFPKVEELSIMYGVTEDSATLFGHFPNARLLSVRKVSGLGNISFANAMPNLTNLYIYNCSGVSATGTKDSLSSCVKLAYLGITESDLEDVSALSGLTSLVELKLDQNALTSLSGIENSTGMVSLSACDNKLTDISAMESLQKLTFVMLDNNQIKEISPLSGCVEMKHLSLDNNKIADVSAFANMPKLISVSIKDNAVSDISPLIGTSDLETFCADNNNIENLDCFEQSIRLSDVSCNNNKITSIEGLKNATKLGSLKLANNNISDISALESNIGTMWTIDLSNNNISDISALADMPKLKMVDISNNEITSIEPLLDSYELEDLFAANNKITSLDGIDKMEGLSVLYAPNNEISDISAYSVSAITASNGVGVVLSHNKIADISALSIEGLSYKLLSIYDNPIEDYAPLTSLGENYSDIVTMGLFANGSSLSYDDAANIAGALYGLKTNLVDTPIDSQNETDAIFSEVGKENGISSTRALPAYISAEEADAKMQEYHDNLYDEIVAAIKLENVYESLEDASGN